MESKKEISFLEIIKIINSGIDEIKENSDAEIILKTSPYIKEIKPKTPKLKGFGLMNLAEDLANFVTKGADKDSILRKGFSIHQLSAILKNYQYIDQETCENVLESSFKGTAFIAGSNFVNQEESDESIMDFITHEIKSNLSITGAAGLAQYFLHSSEKKEEEKPQNKADDSKEKKEDDKSETFMEKTQKYIETIQTINEVSTLKKNLTPDEFDEKKYKYYKDLMNSYIEDSQTQSRLDNISEPEKLSDVQRKKAKEEYLRTTNRKQMVIDFVKKDQLIQGQMTINFDKLGENADKVYEETKNTISSGFEDILDQTFDLFSIASDVADTMTAEGKEIIEEYSQKIQEIMTKPKTFQDLLEDANQTLAELGEYDQIFKETYNKYALVNGKNMLNELKDVCLKMYQAAGDNSYAKDAALAIVDDLANFTNKQHKTFSDSEIYLTQVESALEEYKVKVTNNYFEFNKEDKNKVIDKILIYIKDTDGAVLDLNETDCKFLEEGDLKLITHGFLPITPGESYKINTAKINKNNKQIIQLKEVGAEIDKPIESGGSELPQKTISNTAQGNKNQFFSQPSKEAEVLDVPVEVTNLTIMYQTLYQALVNTNKQLQNATTDEERILLGEGLMHLNTQLNEITSEMGKYGEFDELTKIGSAKFF
ncbi:MAG: hypothetical protein H0U73_10000 [Tatlockia sp.]|nr:hypothetical protein [Tatlockia sp.]